MAQESNLVSLARRIVSCVDAVAKVFEDVELEAFLFRIGQTKASLSSRAMEWMGRCILLCGVVWLNR
jgi:hypothetical protein